MTTHELSREDLELIVTALRLMAADRLEDDDRASRLRIRLVLEAEQQ